MPHLRPLIVFISALLMAHTAAAVDLPSRGSLMHNVTAEYGTPVTTYAPVPAVGTKKNPPITRWDYAEFSVFFEHDHVVHAVSQENRPTVYLD